MTAAGESSGLQPNITWHHGDVDRESRTSLGATVWLTGLSGSGRSTIAAAVEQRIVAAGGSAYLLDGDNIRHGLNADLGFSDADRHENVRRIGHVAQLFADAGVVALVPVISPFRAGRDQARAQHAAAGLPFLEVWVSTPLDECERRDPKQLYAKARAGQIVGMTGIDSAYEEPLHPELVIPAQLLRVDESVDLVLRALERFNA